MPGAKKPGGYSSDLQQNNGSVSGAEMQSHPGTSVPLGAVNDNNISSNPVPGVNRTTSMRSVLTLPAYTPAARPTERSLGREGEREGVDVVLEYPETAEEEESRREQEMESLYNIRMARRTEREVREARRQQQRGQQQQDQRQQPNRQSGIRHVGGSLGVTATTSQSPSTFSTRSLVTPNESNSSPSSLLAPSNPNPNPNTAPTAAALLAEHQAAMRKRERRTSSVAYGSVGVAHHNGTRIRTSISDASSTADMPLLSSAASMGNRSSQRISAASINTAAIPMPNPMSMPSPSHDGLSGEDGGVELHPTAVAGSEGNSISPGTAVLTPSASSSSQDGTLARADSNDGECGHGSENGSGNIATPSPDPPDYEVPPRYESPPIS